MRHEIDRNIIKYHKQGYSTRQISTLLKTMGYTGRVSQPTVSRVIRKYADARQKVEPLRCERGEMGAIPNVSSNRERKKDKKMKKKNSLPVKISRVQHVQRLPGSDHLEIVKVEGRTVVTAMGEYVKGSRVVFISAGYSVPVRKSPFQWLHDVCKFDQTMHRIKEESFFDVVSEGILVDVPDIAVTYKDGARVGRILGATR